MKPTFKRKAGVVPAKVSKKKAKTKAKAAKKKAKDVEIITADLFDALAADSDFIVPMTNDCALIQVKSYLNMPEPIAELFGVPGIPCGLITEIYGPPDSGKTTLANQCLIETQRQGGVAVLLLTEAKYDLPRAEAMGLDMKRLLIRKPRTIEHVQELIHEIVVKVIASGTDKPITIVWDSLGATPCENELNEKRGDFAADGAAAITKLLRKTQAMIKDNSISFIMLNQISTKIGVTFGKKTHAKGGFAPKFFSALRLEFVKIGRVRMKGAAKDADYVAIKTKVEVEKNHLGIPFKRGEFIIDKYGFVFDRDVRK